MNKPFIHLHYELLIFHRLDLATFIDDNTLRSINRLTGLFDIVNRLRLCLPSMEQSMSKLMLNTHDVRDTIERCMIGHHSENWNEYVLGWINPHYPVPATIHNADIATTWVYLGTVGYTISKH